MRYQNLLWTRFGLELLLGQLSGVASARPAHDPRCISSRFRPRRMGRRIRPTGTRHPPPLPPPGRRWGGRSLTAGKGSIADVKTLPRPPRERPSLPREDLPANQAPGKPVVRSRLPARRGPGSIFPRLRYRSYHDADWLC
ncbi:hypothetical protein GGR56DRAFT_649579 [Xylariaceae sp. FL0804]|nr:hypothetical protein GGR56DRAFT_649579 [Xylariaceae sp. FL0804]